MSTKSHTRWDHDNMELLGKLEQNPYNGNSGDDYGIHRYRYTQESSQTLLTAWYVLVGSDWVGSPPTPVFSQFVVPPDTHVMEDFITLNYYQRSRQGEIFNKPCKRSDTYVEVTPYSGLFAHSHADNRYVADEYFQNALNGPASGEYIYPQVDNSNREADKTAAINAAWASAHQVDVMALVDLKERQKTCFMLNNMGRDLTDICKKIIANAKNVHVPHMTPKGYALSTMKKTATATKKVYNALTGKNKARNNNARYEERLRRYLAALNSRKSNQALQNRLKANVKTQILDRNYNRAVAKYAKDAKRREAKAHNKRISQLGDVSNAQLELNYGVLPLVSSIKGALHALSDAPKPIMQTFRGYNGGSDKYVSETTIESAYAKNTWKVEVEREWRYRAGVLTWYLPGSIPAKMGITLSYLPVVIHEVTFLSFVLDWWLPLGDYLQSIQPSMGLSRSESWLAGREYCKSTFTFTSKGKTNVTVGSRSYNFSDWTTRYTLVTIDRNRAVGVTPRFPTWNDQVKSLNHMLSGFALVFNLGGLKKSLRL